MAFFGGLLNALANLFFSGSSEPTNEVKAQRDVEASEAGETVWNGNDYFGNLLNKWTGADLTDAEKSANNFNAQQANIAFQRNLFADSSKYTRAVADMQNAGLNPMLAAGSAGGSSVSSPSASSVSPGSGDVSSIFQFIMGMKNFNLQKSLVQAQINDINEAAKNKAADTALKSAEAARKQEDTRGLKLQNDFFEDTAELRKESMRLQNNQTHWSTRAVIKGIDKVDAEITHLIESAHTEQAKQSLIESQKILANAEAYQIAAMLPYHQAYMSAQTDEAKAAALLQSAHAAYQNGLIDEGYLDSFCKKAAADANISESSAEIMAIKAGIRTGKWQGDVISSWIARNTLTPIANILDNFNPLVSVLK